MKNEIKMEKVSSSNINSVGYDIDTQTLRIEFSYGGIYEYSFVPIKEYNGLKNADSVGKYFHSHIKGKYSFKKI